MDTLLRRPGTLTVPSRGILSSVILPALSSDRVCDVPDTTPVTDCVGVSKTGPISEEFSLVKALETEAGTRKKSHNESPSRKLTASVPGTHPVVFLFPRVSVAEGFASLVTVFPGSLATCPPG